MLGQLAPPTITASLLCDGVSPFVHRAATSAVCCCVGLHRVVLLFYYLRLFPHERNRIFILFVYFYDRQRIFYEANYSSYSSILSLWMLPYSSNDSSYDGCAELAKVSMMATTIYFFSIYALLRIFGVINFVCVCAQDRNVTTFWGAASCNALLVGIVEGYTVSGEPHRRYQLVDQWLPLPRPHLQLLLFFLTAFRKVIKCFVEEPSKMCPTNLIQVEAIIGMCLCVHWSAARRLLSLCPHRYIAALTRVDSVRPAVESGKDIDSVESQTR